MPCFSRNSTATLSHLCCLQKREEGYRDVFPATQTMEPAYGAMKKIYGNDLIFLEAIGLALRSSRPRPISVDDAEGGLCIKSIHNIQHA